MKRFWLVLLSLGLVMAFSASAFAVDVKFSGSFYAAGLYLDKTKFIKDQGTVGDGISTAFYYQRLRIEAELIVSPGLSFVTRFDAMERIWGAPRNTANRGYSTASGDINSSGTTAENENIAFDLAYIKYITAIGANPLMLTVGYQNDGAWGTVFGDSEGPVGKIQVGMMFGPVTVAAYLGKFKDQSATWSAGSTTTAVDRDVDMICGLAKVAFKGGSAGFLYKGYRVAATRAPSTTLLPGNFQQIIHVVQPYVMAQIGPVKVQAELDYAFGDYEKFDSGVGNVSLDNLAGWVDAVVDLGIVYFGGTVAYVAGDDIATPSKKEGGVLSGGTDWNPTLILFNFDRYYWAGTIAGYGQTLNPNANDTFLGTNGAGMSNAWFFQGRAGVRPVAALDIMASVSYAQAVQKWAYVTAAQAAAGGAPSPTNNDSYGWEVDVTGTYKITNNLSYMLGVGYLWTGDYFKGSTSGTLNNDYLIINKLTLTF